MPVVPLAWAGGRYQVSPTYSSTALAPPSFPSHPGSSVLIDYRVEGSSTAENYARCRTGNDPTERCTSFVQHLRKAADWLTAM